MEGINPKYVIRETTYNADGHRDEDSWHAEGNGKPAKLSQQLTYLLGDSTKCYPLSMQFYGDILGKKNTKVIDDYRYTYPVIGRENKPTLIAQTNSTASLGLGHSEFVLYFEDGRLKEQQLIEGPSYVQARIQKIEKQGSIYKATCRLNAVSPNAVLPASDAVRGTKWMALYTPVSLEQSRGTDSNSVRPGTAMNQLGVIRKSMSWGDKRNHDRVMDITVKTDKGSTNNWMSYFMYKFEREWLEECEHVFWYSRFNRDMDTGKVTLQDAITGRDIPTGAGILEQIPNYTTYTRLTYNLLADWMTRALFHQQDAANRQITLWTGKGGIREMDRAMKQEGIKQLQDWGFVADKFVTGEGRNLMLGGFFDGFYHIDGYVVKVKYNPIFDYGRRAAVSKRHPETGLPVESYRMVFIDDNNYDGQENIKYVSLEGENFQHAIVAGITDPPPGMGSNIQSISSSAAPIRSSDINEGSYHRMKSGGIQIMRANGCFHAEYAA